MKQFRVLAAITRELLLVYNNDVQLTFTQWPGCTQEEVVQPDPEAPIPYTGPWKITRMAFRRRFTEDEKTDLEYAALDVPTASLVARKRAAALRVYMQDVLAAEYINLKDVYVRGGLTKLETFGLLAAGRAAAIGDTPPTDEELYK
jgi:hypothetical protein